MWKFITLLAVVSALSEKVAVRDELSSVKDLKNPLTLTSGLTSGTGSPPKNSRISANVLLKRRCRDVYGDDFEKKWDCIRSGTLPTPRIVPITTVSIDTERPTTRSSTSKPSTIEWHRPGDDDDDNHGGDQQRPPTRKPTQRPPIFEWNRPDDDDDFHHGGEPPSRRTTRRPPNIGWLESGDDDDDQPPREHHHSGEHNSHESPWSTEA